MARVPVGPASSVNASGRSRSRRRRTFAMLPPLRGRTKRLRLEMVPPLRSSRQRRRRDRSHAPIASQPLRSRLVTPATMHVSVPSGAPSLVNGGLQPVSRDVSVEELSELRTGAVEARADGALRDRSVFGDLLEAEAHVVVRDHEVAIVLAELGEGGIDHLVALA